ncbi:hypothetical protein CC85DRAFT_283747 [Cutaneotrichosporon oleaginosum]|uniref:Sulfate transporter family protein n=1 Tax=Cutaneotrichosporon oleaginosum TaxID=879819 RepID=A0A0J0XT26_9TREE|nr:uncharacterized protein CC85DRAFT_283747 [Cutaneotrichosporon oleaginosum]KLT44231.1 hypothetical protein CC85DRAFT_283747 [Cutaneotrichosporon oleaginosum]TXT11601.1 hypothetical protein COLE_02011 [Cutaneotrichosporon oleaginosum]
MQIAHASEEVFGSSHTSRAIRESTNRLASMSFTGPSLLSGGLPLRRGSSTSGAAALDLSQPSVSPHAGPSALSMLVDRGRAGDSGETTPHAAPSSLADEHTTADSTNIPTAISKDRARSHSSHIHPRVSLEGVQEVDEDAMADSELRRILARGEPPSERTPLLGKKDNWAQRTATDLRAARSSLSKYSPKELATIAVREPVKALPAVVLGLLLNVLDGVSYGMILFPVSPYYPDYGSLGVSMFFVSCITAQLTYSLGGSIFKGGNGSMMIEAVPFYHIICALIISELGDDAGAIVATTMVSFAFSSLLTGFVFFALGYFKLGSLIGYFPRHILVGCIGGVGVFLFITGLQVSLGLSEDSFEYTFATLKLFFASFHNVVLWALPLALAILLRVITHFFHHQLIFPAYFLLIPAVFYIVVAIGGWDWQYLRDQGWVFDVGQNAKPWYSFYSGFRFALVDWGVFWSAMPTQLALVFFGILHVPLNVPALGVSLAEDNVSLNRELVAHGVSNVASGLVGSVPNYLCYVNTVLFYRVGGDSRLAGLMLAAATAVVMYLGPVVIGYLPITVVAALIYVLGIDLAVESLWDTRHRVNRLEYITIVVIAVGMTVFDFVIGLFIGIILACFFFVLQSSRRRPIRTVFNGSTAKSTVRRPRAQRAFIQRVGSQTSVMKLQGFLFFGTIGVVEDEIRKLLDIAEWEHNPIRFLIIDFALVAGLDFSSAEAFVRIQRLLAAKDVLMILCGAAPHSVVGTALRAVDLWADQEGTRVEVFASLNDALEWTENTYLTAFYENQVKVKGDTPAPRSIDLPKVQRMPFTLAESFQNSPRRTLLARAGDDTLPVYVPDVEDPPRPPAQPLGILLQTIGSYTDAPESFFTQFAPYFARVAAPAGTTLWRQGEAADGLYLIESGSLRATYEYNADDRVLETMVAGTVAGDLSTLSETHRNATVVAERDAVLWKLAPHALAKMEKDQPEAAAMFVKIVLKAAVEEVDVVTSHLIAVLS